MAQKKWLIILGILNVLAVAGIVFWYVNRDNTPPVITQENEIVYEETMSDSELLQGAVAMDETDGDVSHTLVVEKVTVNHNTGIAMVTCGAMDESGNIAKQSFRMAMAKESSVEDSLEEASKEASSGDQAEEVFTLAAGEAANGSEEDSGVGNEAAEGNADVLNDENADSDEDAESEDDADADSENEDAENADADSDEENADEEEAGADSEEDAAEQEAEQARAEAERARTRNQQSAENPVLNFGASEVKTKKGYNPAWVSVISQLQDNKDSYEYLLQHLQIAGEYTNATVGAYDVAVTTVDSDGNTSAARNIRIIVEE